MSDRQQHQQATEQQPGGRCVLQRGHSGQGSRSALELMRQRRDLQSLGSPRPESTERQPDGGA